MSNLVKTTIVILVLWFIGQAVAYFYGGKDAGEAIAILWGLILVAGSPFIYMIIVEDV